jgi:hypothetical protein
MEGAHMSLSYVSLICNYTDGLGGAVSGGTVTFTPTSALAGSGSGPGHVVIAAAPITVDLSAHPEPTVSLLATDTSGITPAGWLWIIAPSFPGSGPARTYALASSPSTQYLSDLTPA